ncbi:PAS domain-containing protein, partial [Sulfurimonas sp. SAG-AH-194-I05]
HPDMSASVFKEMWQTIQNNQVWRGIIKNRKKNGETYYVKSTVSPIVDVHNNIVELIAIRTDITELETYKELLEERLELSNNNLYYLSQYEDAINSFIAVIKTNINGTITFSNDDFCKLSGYSRQELLGKSCQELRTQKHLKNGDCTKIRERLRKKEKVNMLFENIRKSGEVYFIDTHIYPLKNEKGKVIEHLHLMYDITETMDLHSEIESTQKEIIYKMGEIGETRSKETGNHVKRVAEYSKLLAQLIGLSSKHTDMLYAASPMHDIGKVGIPDAILNKPGRLNDEEFEIMKTHSEIGFNILKGSNKPIIKAAAVVAYTHHEKYDGTGYPKGTKAEKIHIFGRITAIVDVFDALGSDRCYKKAWELEKILELFRNEKGKHFDPELIDLFIQNLDKFLETRDKYIDVKDV